MNPTLRNVLAVLAGFIIGSIVNMSIITISGSVIAPPEGADTTTMDGLKASMHLFQPKHFLFPFLAHAIGTFVGALISIFIAANHKKRLALIIAAIFFLGGATNVILLPSPVWFSILDLGVAYFPVGYLAWSITGKK